MTWSPQSLRDVELIEDYVKQFDAAAARRLATRLVAAGESLADFPDRGQPYRRGRRALVTVRPYLIHYRVVGDEVLIDTIRHGARRPL